MSSPARPVYHLLRTPLVMRAQGHERSRNQLQLLPQFIQMHVLCTAAAAASFYLDLLELFSAVFIQHDVADAADIAAATIATTSLPNPHSSRARRTASEPRQQPQSRADLWDICGHQLQAKQRPTDTIIIATTV